MWIIKTFINAAIATFFVYMLDKYAVPLTAVERLLSIMAISYVLQWITGEWGD